MILLAGPQISTATSADDDAGAIKIQAESGNPAAAEAYAMRLEADHYYVDAARWYRRAADAGRGESQYRLGELLLKGRPAIHSDRPALAAQPLAAIGLLTKAAEQGHDSAQLELARCFNVGIGVSANPVEAYRWLLIAAEKNTAAKVERDRVALNLTVDQIQKAQARAKAFLGGDRSDPRIVIVTQADLDAQKADNLASDETTTNDLSRATANEVVTIVVGTNSVVSGKTAATAQVQTNSVATNEEKRTATAWLRNLFSANGNQDRFASIRKVVLPAAFGLLIALIGLIAFVLVIGRVQSRKKASAPGVSARPVAPPPIVRKTMPNRPPPELAQLRALDAFQMEKLMEVLFSHEGFDVERHAGAGIDDGIDLEFSRTGVRTAFQCRRWKTGQIGIKEMAEYLAALKASGFDAGIVVTINNFTAAALELGRKNRTEIFDGAKLVGLLRKHDVPVTAQMQAA